MSSPVMHLDVETKSTIDLRKTGSYVYAEHPTTDLWVACYCFDDGPILDWRPGEPCPDAIFDHVVSGGLVYSHNASFERIIWKYILAPRYGWPEPAVEQFRCTMVMAYAQALPGALEDAAPAAGIDQQKDQAGRRVMLQMSKPRKAWADCLHCGGDGVTYSFVDPDYSETAEFECKACKGAGGGIVWWDQPDKIERLIAYCRQDVEVERELARRLRPLKQSELDLWHLDQRCNDRGVAVDVALCHAAKKVVAATADRLDEAMRETTGGAVAATSNVAQLIGWVKTFGIDTASIAKDVLEELLARDLPAPVRKALELRREAAKASVAKIDALLKGMSPDGRARGLLQFHAASTGRWAGRRFQPQNLKRPKIEDTDTAIEMLMLGDADLIEMVYGEPLSVVGDCIRGMIAAPAGKKIVAADYSNIEGRVLAWLAGERWKIDAFRAFDEGTGPDLYKVMAYRIYGVPVAEVTKPQRLIGKVSELACGYQGGVGAFQSMAAVYLVKVEDALAEDIKTKWRLANPMIRQFWWDLEKASIDAVRSPGVTTAAREIRFKVAGSFLWMRLPSGRFLAYAYPEILPKEMPWVDDATGRPAIKDSLSYMGVNSYTRKWERCFAYGGLLTENAVSGTARDILADAMPRLEAEGYPIILSVHDELVAEVDEGFGSWEEMAGVMKALPAWAAGLPIAAEGFSGNRYRK